MTSHYCQWPAYRSLLLWVLYMLEWNRVIMHLSIDVEPLLALWLILLIFSARSTKRNLGSTAIAQSKGCSNLNVFSTTNDIIICREWTRPKFHTKRGKDIISRCGGGGRQRLAIMISQGYAKDEAWLHARYLYGN